MLTVGNVSRFVAWRPTAPARAVVRCLAAGACLLWFAAGTAQAAPTDPAVKFMAQVGRELMAAARSRSPSLMASVIQKHGDVSYIALYSLGTYRAKLAADDRASYYAGVARWMGSYAAREAPKYQVERVEWQDRSVRGSTGVMVDSRVVLSDGSSYDVRWSVVKVGGSYKVRDASVLGYWMNSLLKDMFEDYVSRHNGNPRALIAILNR